MWKILGINPTTDIKEIKKAYTKLAKQFNPEEHPEEFQKIFDAYKSACAYAKAHKDIIRTVVNEKEQAEIQTEKPDISNEQKPSFNFTGVNENKSRTVESAADNESDEFDFGSVDTTAAHHNDSSEKKDNFDFSNIKKGSSPSEEPANETDEFDFSKVNQNYDEPDEERQLINLRIYIFSNIKRLLKDGTFNEWVRFFENSRFDDIVDDFTFRLSAAKLLNGRPLKKDIAQLIAQKFGKGSVAIVLNYQYDLYQVFIATKKTPSPKIKKKSSSATVVAVILGIVLFIPVIFTFITELVISGDTLPEVKNDSSVITLRPYVDGEDPAGYLSDAYSEIMQNTSFETEDLYKLYMGRWDFTFGYIEFCEGYLFKMDYHGKQYEGLADCQSAEKGPLMTITLRKSDTEIDGFTIKANFLTKGGKGMILKDNDGKLHTGKFISQETNTAAD